MRAPPARCRASSRCSRSTISRRSEAAAHDAHLEFRHAARPELAVRARRRRSVLRRRAGRDRHRRRPLRRRGRRGAGRGRLRGAAGGDRLPDRARARRRCAASSPRTRSSPTRSPTATVDAAFAKAAHVVHEDLWMHRGAAHSMEGRGILAQISDRETTVWASTQKAARSAHRVRRLYRSRRKPAARGDARRRRRLRAEALRLSGGRGGGRRRDAAAPLGQMDRGPPRAFHQCGAGARSILVDRDRRRCRRARARRARPPDPRSRRLCAAGREHPVQFRDHADRPLCGAGAGDGRGRRPTPTRRRSPRCAAPAIRRRRSPWSG